MGFSDLSTRLTDYFFGPHQDQRRVRLMVNREVLDGEFSYLGGTEQFLEDMRNGPDWNNINSSFTTIRDRALYLWDIWKEPHLRGDQYPDVGSHGQDGPPLPGLKQAMTTVSGLVIIFMAGSKQYTLIKILGNTLRSYFPCGKASRSGRKGMMPSLVVLSWSNLVDRYMLGFPNHRSY